jgi:hypothetical protein
MKSKIEFDGLFVKYDKKKHDNFKGTPAFTAEFTKKGVVVDVPIDGVFKKVTVPVRKDNKFDMRYKVCREFWDKYGKYLP